MYLWPEANNLHPLSFRGTNIKEVYAVITLGQMGKDLDMRGVFGPILDTVSRICNYKNCTMPSTPKERRSSRMVINGMIITKK